jgi:hypothetical protein
MKIEIHVFIPYQGQLRARYDDKAKPHQLFYSSDGAYDRLVIAMQTHRHGQRPITCRELNGSTHAEEWKPKLRDFIQEKVVPFFNRSEPEAVYAHNFGPTKGSLPGDVLATFCLVSK